MFQDCPQTSILVVSMEMVVCDSRSLLDPQSFSINIAPWGQCCVSVSSYRCSTTAHSGICGPVSPLQESMWTSDTEVFSPFCLKHVIYDDEGACCVPWLVPRRQELRQTSVYKHLMPVFRTHGSPFRKDSKMRERNASTQAHRYPFRYKNLIKY